MANTRDTIGDQATLDGLVARTLTDFEEDGLTSVKGYALSFSDKLKTLKLPSMATIAGNANAISGLSELETLELPSLKTAYARSIVDCPKIRSLRLPVLQTAYPATLYGLEGLETLDIGSAGTNFGFDNACSKASPAVQASPNLKTVIFRNKKALGDYMYLFGYINPYFYKGVGIGTIFIDPDIYEEAMNLVKNSRYNNLAYRIKTLDEYVPGDVPEVDITKTWDQINADCLDGSYRDKYSIGDTVYVEDGDGKKYRMVLVGKDKDMLSDGTGTAALSFLSCNCYPIADYGGMTIPVRDGETEAKKYDYRWELLTARTYLNGDFFNGLSCKDYIQEVNKVSTGYVYNDSGNYDYKSEEVTTQDRVWWPSVGEIVKNYDWTKEKTGVAYHDGFGDGYGFAFPGEDCKYYGIQTRTFGFAYFCQAKSAATSDGGSFAARQNCTTSPQDHFAFGFCVGRTPVQDDGE